MEKRKTKKVKHKHRTFTEASRMKLRSISYIRNNRKLKFKDKCIICDKLLDIKINFEVKLA